MTADQNINNVIARLSNEHKIIADYAVKFSKGRARADAEFFSGLHSFLDFLKKDLLNHFETEEMVFFPAAVNGSAAYETTLLVLKLQKDHGMLEKELEHVLALRDKAAPGKADPVLINTLGVFFDSLKLHSKREFMELYPLINEDRRCKLLVKQYLHDMRSDRSNPI